jgi:hypothetical protein
MMPSPHRGRKRFTTAAGARTDQSAFSPGQHLRRETAI